MKLYKCKINTSVKIYVVAKCLAEAILIAKDEYGVEPNDIRLVSSEVLVASNE